MGACRVYRPAGLVRLLDVGPTARSVGYPLSVLRTCGTSAWGLTSCDSSSDLFGPPT